MKKILLNSKGSFTVEASIIFSVVFLLICAMVYFFIIMYQYTLIQSAVNQAANSGAAYYVNSSGNSNIYWRIYDLEAENKKRNIINIVNRNLSNSIFGSGREILITNPYKLLMKQLNITIEDKLPMPGGSLFELFGIPSEMSIKAEASVPLNDKAEFIRNMDMVIDIKNCIFNSDNKWIGKDTKINDIISKLIKKK